MATFGPELSGPCCLEAFRALLWTIVLLSVPRFKWEGHSDLRSAPSQWLWPSAALWALHVLSSTFSSTMTLPGFGLHF